VTPRVDVQAALEALAKPVVAAIKGYARRDASSGHRRRSAGAT